MYETGTGEEWETGVRIKVVRGAGKWVVYQSVDTICCATSKKTRSVGRWDRWGKNGVGEGGGGGFNFLIEDKATGACRRG